MTQMGPLSAIFKQIVDVVLPPQCLKCQAPVTETGTLCQDCWDKITFIDGAQCRQCGRPFEFDPGMTSKARDAKDGVLCGACIRKPPLYDRARAVFLYDDHSRDLILAFKHADRTDAAPAFGMWLTRIGASLIADADIIAPVPLHWTRMASRRFNQSALLAHVVAKKSGRPIQANLLRRIKKTPSQGGLGAKARFRNVQGAFQVTPRHTARLLGKRVLLIDDVFTTGATLEAATRTLLRAGAGAVDVLTLARVPKPDA